jgi:hypothetical protein
LFFLVLGKGGLDFFLVCFLGVFGFRGLRLGNGGGMGLAPDWDGDGLSGFVWED